MDPAPAPRAGTMSAAAPAPTAPSRPVPYLSVRGLATRVVASIGIVFGGAILLLIYLGFSASTLPWYSNVVVVLVIFLGGIGSLAALWASWGMRMFRENAERFAGPFFRAPPNG